MPVNVLVVDDSAFFRRRIKEILEKSPELKVVGIAENGRDAIDQAARLKPDVITMDYEMPLLDGISAVREIMASTPTPILMFSSLTYEGARVTLDALEAGALDYLPKSFESMSSSPGESAKMLQDRVLAIARKRPGSSRPAPVPAPQRDSAPQGFGRAPLAPARAPAKPRAAATPAPARQSAAASRSAQASIEALRQQRPRVIIIGASTGGPVALQKILTELPGNFPYPILLVQHMPSTFTAAFAQRLDKLSQLSIREARDNDQLKPGVALLAPGGKQMLIDARGQSVSIVDGNDRIQFKPSVDVTLGSAARAIKGKVLALVLTGMGSDGREGAKMLKREGAVIWSQDEASCVVFGMPAAVEKAGLSDAVLPLDTISARLRDIM